MLISFLLSAFTQKPCFHHVRLRSNEAEFSFDIPRRVDLQDHQVLSPQVWHRHTFEIIWLSIKKTSLFFRRGSFDILWKTSFRPYLFHLSVKKLPAPARKKSAEPRRARLKRRWGAQSHPATQSALRKSFKEMEKAMKKRWKRRKQRFWKISKASQALFRAFITTCSYDLSMTCVLLSFESNSERICFCSENLLQAEKEFQMASEALLRWLAWRPLEPRTQALATFKPV